MDFYLAHKKEAIKKFLIGRYNQRGIEVYAVLNTSIVRLKISTVTTIKLLKHYCSSAVVVKKCIAQGSKIVKIIPRSMKIM